MAVFAPEYEDVAEAAKRLGVSVRRVRQLINDGQIEAVRVGNMWLVLRDSVERRAELDPPAGRPWNAEVAWGVVAMLSGADDGDAVDAIAHGSEDLHERLQRVLERFHEGKCLRDLAAYFRRRAFKHRLYGHPAVLPILAEERHIVRSGASAAPEYGLDILPDGQFEAYIPSERLAHLKEKYFLMEEGRGAPNIVLRAVDSPWPFAPHSPVAPLAAVALDLLESDDPRYRRAGVELSEQLQAKVSAR